MRIDRQTVRIYFRNDMIKVHPRVGPGERSTDPNDYPTGKAIYSTRNIESLIQRAYGKSEPVGIYVERLLEGPLPWTRMRQAYALLRLCDKYGIERVDEVCRRSLDFDVLDIPRIARMLRTAQRLEDAGNNARKLIRLPRSKFERPQDSFRTVAASGKKEGEES